MMKRRRLRWAGHAAHRWKERNTYRILVGKSEGRTPLGIPRRRWEYNIKIDLKEIGWGVMDWIDLAEDRDQ
jgi:hypothetical protein